MVQKAVFMERVFTLRNLRSAGAAAAIEVLLAAGIAALLIWQQVGPSIKEKITVPPVVIPDTTPPPLQPTVAPVLEQTQAPQLHEVTPIPTDVPTEQVVPVQPPLAPLVPDQRTQPAADAAGQFTTAMLQSINQQKVYPKISLMQGVTGEAVVSFDYVDGVVSNIRVDRSSGSRELDRAAVEAVQKAALPPKPAELTNLRHFVFHLVFGLG